MLYQEKRYTCDTCTCSSSWDLEDPQVDLTVLSSCQGARMERQARDSSTRLALMSTLR